MAPESTASTTTTCCEQVKPSASSVSRSCNCGKYYLGRDEVIWTDWVCMDGHRKRLVRRPMRVQYAWLVEVHYTDAQVIEFF